MGIPLNTQASAYVKKENITHTALDGAAAPVVNCPASFSKGWACAIFNWDELGKLWHYGGNFAR